QLSQFPSLLSSTLSYFPHEKSNSPFPNASVNLNAPSSFFPFHIFPASLLKWLPSSPPPPPTTDPLAVFLINQSPSCSHRSRCATARLRRLTRGSPPLTSTPLSPYRSSADSTPSSSSSASSPSASPSLPPSSCSPTPGDPTPPPGATSTPLDTFSRRMRSWRYTRSWKWRRRPGKFSRARRFSRRCSKCGSISATIRYSLTSCCRRARRRRRWSRRSRIGTPVDLSAPSASNPTSPLPWASSGSCS
ncbi:unnamed protein product, partial [Linum tenue]